MTERIEVQVPWVPVDVDALQLDATFVRLRTEPHRDLQQKLRLCLIVFPMAQLREATALMNYYR